MDTIKYDVMKNETNPQTKTKKKKNNTNSFVTTFSFILVYLANTDPK